jgi:hypothetical protein
MKPIRLLTCLAAMLLALFSSRAYAQTTIAKWTFESLSSSFPSYVPGAGVSTTNFYAEQGAQAGVAAITGWHSGYGTPTYSSPVGNGSLRSLSANGWTNYPGDYWQIAVSTTGFTNISLVFDAVGSGTGPRDFKVMYSTDGSTFTQFATYTVVSSPSWTSGSTQVGETYTYDFSSITALANQSTVYFRLVDNSTNNIGGGSGGGVATGGTSRIDNVAVSGSVPGAPSILAQPQGVTNFWGDTATFAVTAGGDNLSFQWYYPNLSTPLANGSSGYGAGMISGSTTNVLVLSYVDTNQAGNYQVIITNTLGSITSSVAHLQIGVRTPILTNIAFLRRNQDTINWRPIDTTNIYSVTGIVTTTINISGSGNSTEFFIQDGNSGICVFMGGDLGGTFLRNQGDLVRVTGPVANFNGLMEFNLNASNPSHSISAALSTGNPMPAVKYFNLGDYANTPYMETNIEGSLIVVSNVFLNQTSLQFASGAMNITNANRKYVGLYVPTTAYGVIGGNVPRIAASITGVMGQYYASLPANDGYQLYLLNYTDLTSTTNVPAMPLYLNKYPTNGPATNVVVSWWGVDPFQLQSATDVMGPYTDVGVTTPPYTNTVNGNLFYRLWQY